MSTQPYTPAGMDHPNIQKGVDAPESSNRSDAETLQLARRLSAKSKDLGKISPINAPEGGALDPSSEKIDANHGEAFLQRPACVGLCPCDECCIRKPTCVWLWK
jgi:hypothetical protein